MYLAVPPQPNCSSAWLAAASTVDGMPGHEAHNVIVGVENPLVDATLKDPVIATVDKFLAKHGKSVECIANTIFPKAVYQRHGAPQFIEIFHDRLLPKIRKNERWSGYYFDRMTRVPRHDGEFDNQLWDIVERMRDPNNRSLNKYELSLFDPERDVDNSPYGGQCLSFLSFKLQPSTPKKLMLTAVYRNQYYTEKLLGNLIGLGRLMEFVAREAKLEIGNLVVISTHAQVDNVGGKRSEVTTLLQECGKILAVKKAA